MNLINNQNLIYSLIGILLAVTIFSVLQIGSRSKLPPKDVLKSTAVANPNLKSQNTTLVEPGLYQIQLPEQFNFAPEKKLVQLTSTESATYYRYQSADNISAYEITYVRFPDETFQSKPVRQILDDWTDTELLQLNASLSKESTVQESHNLIRREVEMQSHQGDLFIRSNFIVNRPYVYFLRYTSKNKANLHNPKIQSFFDSFKLFEQVPPQTIIVSPERAKDTGFIQDSTQGNSSLSLPSR